MNTAEAGGKFMLSSQFPWLGERTQCLIRMVNYLLLKNKNLLIKSTKIFKLNNVGKLCVRVVIDYAILCQRSC